MLPAGDRTPAGSREGVHGDTLLDLWGAIRRRDDGRIPLRALLRLVERLGALDAARPALRARRGSCAAPAAHVAALDQAHEEAVMAALISRDSLTVERIDAAYVRDHHERDSRRLGASILGRPCRRQLWLGFRWVARPAFAGRMLRLFATGHVEEQRMADDLRRIGVEVHQVDPSTGAQYEATACHGHVVAKLDGAVLGVPEAPKTWHVWEAKTHSSRSFERLVRLGVAAAKPEHEAQCQLGMHLTGMSRCLYMAKDKNDDALYTERLSHDAARCEALLARALEIITSAAPPAPEPCDSCEYCDLAAACRLEVEPRRVCRTCAHATPTLEGDGAWRCRKAGAVQALVSGGRPEDYEAPLLSVDEQLAGCPEHLLISELVPLPVVEREPLATGYRTADGSTWWDGVRVDADVLAMRRSAR